MKSISKQSRFNYESCKRKIIEHKIRKEFKQSSFKGHLNISDEIIQVLVADEVKNNKI